MSKNISTLAIYSRQAYATEGENDLKKQEEILVQLCKKRGWKHTIYKESGSGLNIEKHFKLKKLLNEIKANLYDAVMVADISQLSMNLLDLEKIKGVLASSNTRLYIGDTEMSLAKNNDDKRLEEIKCFISRMYNK